MKKAFQDFRAMNTAVIGECSTQIYIDVSLFSHDDISEPVLAEISSRRQLSRAGAITNASVHFVAVTATLQSAMAKAEQSRLVI